MADDLWEIAQLQPEDALAYWQERVPITRTEWEQLDQLHQARAFTVSGVTSIHFLSAIYDAIEQAMAEGLTLEEFDARVAELGASRGFVGEAPHHLHTVFFNNTTNAYMAGRFRQMTHPQTLEKRPFWVYDAVDDDKTRPSHRALDGTARRYDDLFWRRYYPPNGHFCRCDVITASPAEVQQLGIKVEEGIPAGSPAPDPGWETDPVTAFARWEPDLAQLPAPLRDAYVERRKAGD